MNIDFCSIAHVCTFEKESKENWESGWWADDDDECMIGAGKKFLVTELDESSLIGHWPATPLPPWPPSCVTLAATSETWNVSSLLHESTHG